RASPSTRSSPTTGSASSCPAPPTSTRPPTGSCAPRAPRRSAMRSARVVLALAGALAAGGCNWWYNDVPSPDDLMKVVPWFDHMITSPAVHPYETAGVPRTTPPGTVPVGDTEPDVGAAWATGDFAAAEVFTNPYGRGDLLARG